MLAEVAGATGRRRSTSCSTLAPLPDPASASLLWQAVVGAWPIVAGERLHAYAEKAMREAGDRTTWTDPDAEYEARGARAPSTRRSTTSGCARCLEALGRSARRGRAAATRWPPSCSRSTMPGVPDVYQGTELGDQSLVDPDNRRPVDFDRAPLRRWPTASHAPKQAVDRAGAPAAARPARAVHDYTPVVRRRAGRRPRARLRPRRRRHGRDPAAARPRRQGRLGRHHARPCPTARRPACADLLGDCPVRLLGRRSVRDS